MIAPFESAAHVHVWAHCDAHASGPFSFLMAPDGSPHQPAEPEVWAFGARNADGSYPPALPRLRPNSCRIVGYSEVSL